MPEIENVGLLLASPRLRLRSFELVMLYVVHRRL
jgi:hypothetical protein